MSTESSLDSSFEDEDDISLDDLLCNKLDRITELELENSRKEREICMLRESMVECEMKRKQEVCLLKLELDTCLQEKNAAEERIAKMYEVLVKRTDLNSLTEVKQMKENFESRVHTDFAEVKERDGSSELTFESHTICVSREVIDRLQTEVLAVVERMKAKDETIKALATELAKATQSITPLPPSLRETFPSKIKNTTVS